MYLGFSHVSDILHDFVMARLAASSIKVNRHCLKSKIAVFNIISIEPTNLKSILIINVQFVMKNRCYETRLLYV